MIAFSESFITAGMFEVSACANFPNEVSTSVHQLTVIKVLLFQSKQADSVYKSAALKWYQNTL